MSTALTRDGVAPFIKSLIQMLETTENNHLIRWGRLGESIVITNCAEFETKLLPKYFKTGKFCSFIRQLNIYGFHKVDDEKSAQNEELDHESSESQARIFEFANDFFKKHQPDLMINIKRRKSVRRSLTVNNNNPNQYRTSAQNSYADDEDDIETPISYPTNISIPSSSAPITSQNSSHSTPAQSPITDVKFNNDQFDPTVQSLIFQYNKQQTEYTDLKFSHTQLQDSHSQLQFAFQNLQQSHQSLMDRVLKLTKAILGNSIIQNNQQQGQQTNGAQQPPFSPSSLQNKQNSILAELSSISGGLTNSPTQSQPLVSNNAAPLQQTIQQPPQQQFQFTNFQPPLQSPQHQSQQAPHSSPQQSPIQNNYQQTPQSTPPQFATPEQPISSNSSSSNSINSSSSGNGPNLMSLVKQILNKSDASSLSAQQLLALQVILTQSTTPQTLQQPIQSIPQQQQSNVQQQNNLLNTLLFTQLQQSQNQQPSMSLSQLQTPTNQNINFNNNILSSNNNGYSTTSSINDQSSHQQNLQPQQQQQQQQQPQQQQQQQQQQQSQQQQQQQQSTQNYYLPYPVKEEPINVDDVSNAKDLQSFLLDNDLMLNQSSDFLSKRNKSLDNNGLSISSILPTDNNAFFNTSNQSTDASKLNQMDFGLYY